MQDLVLPDDTIYLGVDGGGTKCSAVLMTSDGEVIGTGIAGPANPFQGKQQTIESIHDATGKALESAGLEAQELARVVAGIGLAGLNLPAVHKAMNIWEHPFGHMFLTTDLEIGCVGAHNGRDGAVIVVGTGSSGFSMVKGQSTVLGAHGFAFGDTGSGAWLGLQAIRAVLMADDGIGPDTLLTASVSDKLQAKGNSIVEKMAGARPSDYAVLAGSVFAAANGDDSVAVDIIERGAGYLNAMADRLWATNPPAMSILGGLRQLITPWLDSETTERLSPPEHSAEIGAVLYAQQKHRDLLAAA